MFLGTWFLHSYQWFWLEGEWLFTLPDILFWSILALFMLGNSWWEFRHGRARRLTPTAPSLWDRLATVCKTLATFLLVCVLWSLWSSESTAAWLKMWDAAGIRLEVFLAGLAVLYGLAAACKAIGRRSATPARKTVPRPRSLLREAIDVYLPAAVLMVLGLPAVAEVGGNQPNLQPVGGWLAEFRDPTLSDQNLARIERGYYERLTRSHWSQARAPSVQAERPADWVPLAETEIITHHPDFLQFSLTPSHAVMFQGHEVRTNRFGMRDDECDVARSAGIRLALFGASHPMGVGVAAEEVVDRRLEVLLQEVHGVPAEVLNFAVAGYSLLQSVTWMEQQVPKFRPDMVMLFIHSLAMDRCSRHILQLLKDRIPIKDPSLKETLKTTGLKLADINERALRRHEDKILCWAMSSAATICGEAARSLFWCTCRRFQEVPGTGCPRTSPHAGIGFWRWPGQRSADDRPERRLHWSKAGRPGRGELGLSSQRARAREDRAGVE